MINKAATALVRNPANQFPRSRISVVRWLGPEVIHADKPDVQPFGRKAARLAPLPILLPITFDSTEITFDSTIVKM